MRPALFPIAFLFGLFGVVKSQWIPKGDEHCPYGFEYIEKFDFCYGYPGKGGVTMEFARSQCQELGGDLISIHSQEEFDFVRELRYSEGGEIWLGLYRDSWTHYYWLDGTPEDFHISIRWNFQCFGRWTCCYIMAHSGIWPRPCDDGSTDFKCKLAPRKLNATKIE